MVFDKRDNMKEIEVHYYFELDTHHQLEKESPSKGENIKSVKVIKYCYSQTMIIVITCRLTSLLKMF